MKKMYMGLMAGVLLVLSACGNGGSTTNKDAGGNSAAPAAKKDPVTLNVYYPFVADWSKEDFDKVFAQPLHQKYPYITLNYYPGGTAGQNLTDLIAAGTKIDLVYTSTGQVAGNLLDPNLQFDITPLIQQNKFDLSTLDPTIVDTDKLLGDGKIYGLPVYVPPSAVYYNKDIFDKFGVSYPKDGMTWDDYYEMAKKLTRTESGQKYFGLGVSEGHYANLNSFSATAVDAKQNPPKTTFSSDPNWKTIVDNLVRFYQLPGATREANQYNEPNERNMFFKDHNTAMFTAMTALHSAQEINGMNFDIASYPTYASKPGVGPQPYPTMYFITSVSDHKQEAFETAAYFASTEFQTMQAKAGVMLPILKDRSILKQFASTGDSPYKGKNVIALEPAKYALPGQVNKFNGALTWDFGGGIVGVAQGKTDVNSMIKAQTENGDKKVITMAAPAK